MKITQDQYRKAYECGQKVFLGEMRITDAKASVHKFGVNSNSATDMVYNLGHMLRGERYTRALSTAATTDYLKWISEDYGTNELRNAVSALKQHIEYYQSISGSPMRSLRKVLEAHSDLLKSASDFVKHPEEENEDSLLEGRVRKVSVNIYERNPAARKKCIQHHGTNCSVCSFDFSEVFGPIGAEFIHVHHLKELSSVGKEYEIDPIKDLRPVCPNCHAMLHKGKPAYSISELQKAIRNQHTNKSNKAG